MARLRLFAAAREAAGTNEEIIDGATIADVLEEAQRRFGASFTDILKASKVWLNGEESDVSTAVTDSDEIAVLPPVSGGGL
jgi:molybdopterin synthase sulfur carrier subunit